tara:strand:- start:4552 stop:5445 length:894 start_codon:yes stop_codon:yes gene_type:complete
MTTLEKPPVGADRILVGTAATIYAYKLDGTGEAVDAGTVTVTVTGADGNVVMTAQTATEDTATHQLSRTLTATQNNQLDWLTAVWTDASDSTSWTTYHEAVGGFYFTVSQARRADPTFASSDYSAETLRALRDEVEREFESDQAIGRGLVPRYARERVSEGYVSKPDLRRVRSITGIMADGETWEPFTAAQILTIPPADLGAVVVPGYAWPAGDFVIEYEYGLDRLPSDLSRAILERLRYLSGRTSTGIPDKALTFSANGPGGGSYGLAVEGRAGFITAMPGVDLLIKRYRVRPPVG